MMRILNLSFLFLFVSLLEWSNSAPAPVHNTCDPNDYMDCGPPPEFSVYLCEYTNWTEPCYVYWLNNITNDATYDWKEERNVSFWPDGTWDVGSLGPAKGVVITVFNPYEKRQETYEWPGSPDVGPYWRSNIYTFDALWLPPSSPLPA